MLGVLAEKMAESTAAFDAQAIANVLCGMQNMDRSATMRVAVYILMCTTPSEAVVLMSVYALSESN